MKDLPPTGMWYWGDSSGSPVALHPLITLLHEHLHIQYLADRDKHRATLPTPLPRYWYDNTLRYAEVTKSRFLCGFLGLDAVAAVPPFVHHYANASRQ